MTLGLGDVDFGYICAGCHSFIQYSQCHDCEGFDLGSANSYPALFELEENKMDNLLPDVQQDKTIWIEFFGVDVKLPEESGQYHVLYKIPDVDHLVECIIDWDNDKQVWVVPPTWKNEDVWLWSPTYRSRKIA